MRSYLSLWIVALCSVASAQTVITVGQPVSNNAWPFRDASSRYQTAYRANELPVPGGSQLIEIRVRECQQGAQFQVPAAGTFTNLRVRLGHTTADPATGMTGNFDQNYTGALTTCLGPVNYSPIKDTNSYFVFALATPFVYNGTQNMLLDWSFDGNTSGFWIHHVPGRQRIRASPAGFQTATGGVYGDGDWQVQFVFLVGPTLAVVATPGTQQVVPNNAQGPGNNGLVVGEFTLSSTAQTTATDPAVTAISIQAAGSGLDHVDFSYVAVWRDANATNAFEAGADTLIGTAAAAFPSDNGTLTFNVQAAQQLFGASETRRYFVVAKLAGSAAPGSTFTFRVSDLTIGAGTFKNGVPSVVMNGLRTLKPTLTAVVVAGVAQNVFSSETGGGNGFEAAKFDVSANNEGAPAMTAIQLGSGGTGDDGAAYSEVALYRESNATPGYQGGAGGDTLIAANAAFSANDGTANFAVPGPEQAIPPGTTRTFYIVVKLNSTALPAQTFNYLVNAITPAAGSTSEGVPSTSINGLVISTPVFTYTDASAAAAQTAYVFSQGNVCQEFTLAYPGGPDDKPTGITVTGLGTGHEVNHLAGVALWMDADQSGAFEPANDTLVDSGSYALDNGTVVFDLTGHPDFSAGTTRTYFVVYDLNLSAQHNTTFRCYVSAASGMSHGGVNAGLPCPDVGGAPGLLVNATLLTATVNGPGSALTVHNNSSGNTGSGELLLDFTLSAASGQAWPLTDITFAASGTAAHDTAYTQVALHEDSGNGIWDGSGTDGAAAGSLTGFGAGPGYQATFQFSNGMVGSGQSRRFFLVGRLNGTATTGQTLNARIESVAGNLPAGGVQIGFPSMDSTALIIEQTALTVLNAPGAPSNQLHKAGSALAFVMAKFRLAASNDTVSVSGVTLTGTGNGNWVTGMDAATGVQVYRDNGDGVFDNATDPLLYQGAGSSTMNAVFSASLDVPTRGHRDIWVRTNLLASAGLGSTNQQSYTVAIVQATDVAAGVTRLIGTPPPNGAILNVVDFFVSEVDPLSDAPAGGKVLTITGSGFLSPFTMTIDGVVCPGTPTITPTMVTGLQVPPGSGSGKAIVITSGSLAPLTLTDTFSYVVPGNPSGPSDGGGCTAAPTPLATLALPLLAMIGLRRRRK